jgi:hypothetical protein
MSTIQINDLQSSHDEDCLQALSSEELQVSGGFPFALAALCIGCALFLAHD